MWVTTARFAHCLRCTNCSRHFCTEDYTQCLTRNKRKIRLASENPTRQQTTLQRTEWLSRNVTSGESKCGQRQLTSRRRSTPSPTNLFGRHSNLATSITSTSASWGRYAETRNLRYRQTKRATFSRSEKEPRWPAVQLAVQHGSFIFTEGRNSTMAKEKRNWYVPERPRPRLPHKPEIRRRRAAVHNIQRTATENVVWIQEKYLKSGTYDSSRQDEDSQQPEHYQLGHKKKRTWSWRHENRNTDKTWKREIFRSENLVPPPRNDGNQESYQGSMGDIPQIQTRVDIGKLHAQSSSTAIRRRNISDHLLRNRNMGTRQRTRKNDSIGATQDVTAHHSNKKEIQKRSRNKIWDQRRNWRNWHQWNKCVALMMKAVADWAQQLTMTWTVTFHLKTMLMKKLRPHQSKKKTGLNTQREALKKP